MAIPLLLGLIGWAGLDKDADVDVTMPSVNPSATLTAPNVNTPEANAPNVNLPNLSFAPLSILRNGNGFTLSGDLPDLAAKTSLLDSLKLAFGPDIDLTDNLNIKAGVNAPDFSVLGSVLKAAVDIPDFNFDLNGDTLTLTGTAPSEDVKADVEAAAKAAWPDVKIVNNIQVQAAATDACAGTRWWRVRHAAGRHHRTAQDADQLPDRRVHPGAGITAAADPGR